MGVTRRMFLKFLSLCTAVFVVLPPELPAVTDGDPHIPKKILKCADCGGTAFYRTGGQLHSSPPWDMFGCKRCHSIWAVNCMWIYSHYRGIVIYDIRGSVRFEGKPCHFIDKDGKRWSFNEPPGIPPRTEAEYAVYRSDRYKGPPAVGTYEVFNV
jgi:hypothetical protein